MTATLARPIDPFAPMPAHGYDDGLVRVAALRPGRPAAGARTAHFRVRTERGVLVVAHRLPPEAIDNDIGGLIADELIRPGLVADAGLFERIFVGIVRSSSLTAHGAWDMFYANSIRRVHECWRGVAWWGGGQLADMAPVYRRAIDLTAPGRVLDLGSCFGLLPLLLAGTGRHQVVASDIAPGSMRLLATIARRRGTPVGALVRDAATTRVPDNSFDTVTVLHLLEHLDRAHGRAVVAEAIRVARRRVVIAVPFEETPDPVYGHIRSFDLPELAVLGVETGLPYHVAEYHGGWLVIDVG
ncbi:mycofactocin oligosaccharide methyltransferase MftM [Nocardia cyriacigeorgica]|uniref:mycofactocin oligosaccharide methyltransferase MftM n=1 Tax=Nocardia cyriacigeorgica TaxID=135487 RepID=UPI002458880F|nr:mycofactocin oligosaccharide methyltransferase MftM [Nocardia cyriacigeorgica]